MAVIGGNGRDWIGQFGIVSTIALGTCRSCSGVRQKDPNECSENATGLRQKRSLLPRYPAVDSVHCGCLTVVERLLVVGEGGPVEVIRGAVRF